MDDARRTATEPERRSLEAPPTGSGQTSPSLSRHHRSPGSRTHRHRSTADRITSRRRQQRLLRALIAAIVVVLCLAVGLLLALLLRTTRQSHSTEQRLMGKIVEEQQRAERRAAEAEQLRAQRRDLVSGRLPLPLRPLVLETQIELDQAPLRNILFTQVGTPEHPGYEYRLYCKNEGPERFFPHLRILLFNEAGVQTGAANLSDSAGATRLGAAGMAVGESSTFSGSVTLEFADVPNYFLILHLDPGGRRTRLFD